MLTSIHMFRDFTFFFLSFMHQGFLHNVVIGKIINELEFFMSVQTSQPIEGKNSLRL